MPGEDTAVFGEVDNGGAPEEPLEAFFNEPEEPEAPAESEPDETTDSVESPFVGKPLDEVAKDPVVEQLLKDREARLNESYRQKVENDNRQAQAYWEQQAFQQRQTEAESIRKGAAHRALQGLVKNALERGEDIRPESLGPIANSLANAVFHEQFDALSQFERNLVFEAVPDYRPSPEIVGQLEQARRTANPQALAAANTRMVSEALWQAQWPHALQAAYDYMQSQQQVNGVKNAATTRAAQAKPTAINGPAARQKTYTLQQIEDMPMKEWDSIPEKERERILATAR